MPDSNFDEPPNEECQLFVGNLKGVISEELLEIKFSPYGRIKRIDGKEADFAIIEYEQPQSATLAEVEMGSLLVKRKLFVRKFLKNGERCDFSFDADNIPDPPKIGLSKTSKRDEKVNQIEIITVSEKVLPFAEKIEKVLKKLDFTVDVVKPNVNVPETKIFGALATSGVLFGIILEPANVENQSLTYMVLHEQGLEYRNVPLKEAYKQIYANYVKHCKKITKEVHHHPQGIQFLLDLLLNNRTLTVLQHDQLLKYLNERRYKVRYEEEEKDGKSSRSSRYYHEEDFDTCGGFGGDSESETGSDDSYENIPMRERWVGMRIPKKKKPKKDCPVNILTQPTMIQSISNKIKRNSQIANDKDKSELRNKLIDRERLKNVMDDLNGIKRSWWL